MEFKWVSGPPRTEEAGDVRLVLVRSRYNKKTTGPCLVEFAGGRWDGYNEGLYEIVAHAPFVVPTSRKPFKVEAHDG